MTDGCHRPLRAALVVGLIALAKVGWAQDPGAEANAGTVGIMAGLPGETSLEMVQDMAFALDQHSGLRVLPIQGVGSLQAIADLLYLRGVDAAVLQSDAMSYGKSSGTYPGLDRVIHYITKLYDAEVHVLASQQVRSIADLANRTVNIGLPGGGTEVTASLIFEAAGIPVRPTRFDHELALAKLRAGEIAAMIVVGGKPVPLLAELGWDETLHFVPVDLSQAVAGLYAPATLDHLDYALVPEGISIPTVSVDTLLVSYAWDPSKAQFGKVANFVTALFSQLDRLQQPERHPKWHQVNIRETYPDWTRFRTASEWLDQAPAPTIPLADLESAFAAFLADRSSPADSKNVLFREFLKWHASQP